MVFLATAEIFEFVRVDFRDRLCSFFSPVILEPNFDFEMSKLDPYNKDSRASLSWVPMVDLS